MRRCYSEGNLTQGNTLFAFHHILISSSTMPIFFQHILTFSIFNIVSIAYFWHLLIHQYSRQQVMLVAGGGEKRKISNTTFFFPPVSYLVLPTGAFYDFHWENGISCHNRIVIRMETHLKWNPYSPSLTNSIRLRKITIDYIIQCHISLHI